MSEFENSVDYRNMKRPGMHFIIRVGLRDSVAAGFLWEKWPEIPMGEVPIGTTKCTKYKIQIPPFYGHSPSFDSNCVNNMPGQIEQEQSFKKNTTIHTQRKIKTYFLRSSCCFLSFFCKKGNAGYVLDLVFGGSMVNLISHIVQFLKTLDGCGRKKSQEEIIT